MANYPAEKLVDCIEVPLLGSFFPGLERLPVTKVCDVGKAKLLSYSLSDKPVRGNG